MQDSSRCRESVDKEALPGASDLSTAATITQLPSTSSNNIADNGGDVRRQVGRLVVDVQQTIDSHLTLFRMALMVTVAASIAVSVKVSGLLKRVNNVEEIPLWQFARRKKLRVRMIRQSRQDASIFYVYHTPFLRRILLKDELPKSLIGAFDETKSDLIAIRPFGVKVDEIAEEWIWANFVSSHRYMTIQLLQRFKVATNGSVATCTIALRRPPFRGDFALELVSRGYAECIPETVENYDNGSLTATSSLSRRLRNLQVAQKHAQIMQYGVWKEWQETKISDRVLSAGRRATIKGVKRLIDTLRG